MNLEELLVPTHGERFYNITDQIKESHKTLNPRQQSGIFYLFLMHTSCGLCLNEAFDPSAQKDLESFLKILAPRNASFITHTTEGPDDSPSHMKSLLTSQSLILPVEQGKLMLGTWQGIYLCEFRDVPHQRKIMLKFKAD